MRGPDRGYEEANDYDREIERPENVKFDDESWSGFAKSFNQMETENFTLDLNEKELIGQIGDKRLGSEIRSAVDGHAGIQADRDRYDLGVNIHGAKAGWNGVKFGRRMRK